MRVLNVPSCAAGVPIFQALPAASLASLGESLHHRRFAKGEIVAAAGERLDHLIVVAKGQLKLVRTSASGREQVVRTLGQGDFIGELALFAPMLLEGDLVAVEDAATCAVPRQAMQNALSAHPAAALALVAALAERLADAEELIANLGLHDVGQRLANALLRLASAEWQKRIGGQAGRDGQGDREGQGKVVPADNTLQVQVPVPWAEMAIRLGTTPESLSRRLKSLVDQGIIQQNQGRSVTILDFDALSRLARG